MPISEPRRAPPDFIFRLALAGLLAFAACRDEGRGSGAGGNGGNTEETSCHLFKLGSTCAISLAPYDVQDFVVTVPGQGWTQLTVSLTGSTTRAAWVLEGTMGRIAQCDGLTWGIDQSCVAYLPAGASYHVLAYETEGRAGTTNLTIGRSVSLGSVAVPVPVSTESLVNASVGANGASYFAFQAIASATHTIAVTGLFSQLSWELYSDAAFTDRVAQCVYTDQAEDLACPVSLTVGSTYYLKVREFSGAAQDFRLSIGSGAANEGSPERPVALSVAAAARVSSVDVFGHSYYTLTPSVSGPHTILLDGHYATVDGIRYSFHSDYAWTLFDDPGFTHIIKDCRDYRMIDSGAEHCVATLAAGASYYLRVDERAGYPNRAYELSAVARTAGGGTSDGSLAAPIPIAFTSGWGSVAAHGSSYYSFQSAVTPASYRIMASSEPDDFYSGGANLTWSLFDDPGFSNEISRCAAATGIVVQSCLTPELAASTTYYLRVDEHDGIAQNFGLVLAGGFRAPTASAPNMPLSIPVGAAGLDVVQDNTLSAGYYAFATTQPGTYRITANLSTGANYALVGWHVYDDAAYSHPVAHCFQTGGIGTEGTTCTVHLPEPAKLYLRVDAVGRQSGDPLSKSIGGNDLHLAVEAVSL